MKNRLLRILSFALILTGIILLALPMINQKKIGDRTANNYEVTLDMSADTLKDNMKTETSFDFDSIEEISTSGTWLSPEYIDPSLMIGRLYIPSIDVNVTVFNGITNDILHAGVGTMRPGLTMGEGNFPIAGHYSHDPSIIFGDLTSVVAGDKIYLTNNETIYEYEVYDTKVVKPNEVHWIEDKVAEEHGKPVISLMNCYYVNRQNTGDRFFVFGELVDSYPMENEDI